MTPQAHKLQEQNNRRRHAYSSYNSHRPWTTTTTAPDAVPGVGVWPCWCSDGLDDDAGSHGCYYYYYDDDDTESSLPRRSTTTRVTVQCYCCSSADASFLFGVRDDGDGDGDNFHEWHPGGGLGR